MCTVDVREESWLDNGTGDGMEGRFENKMAEALLEDRRLAKER